jgi:hypothetical protein
MAVWSRRIHTSGVHRKWLLLSEDWEILNVFSLPEIKYCFLEWMVVFSSIYPSTTCKVCVDMLELMIACVHNFRVSLKRKKTGEDKQSEPNDKE